jgi:hypothetical protein
MEDSGFYQVWRRLALSQRRSARPRRKKPGKCAREPEKFMKKSNLAKKWVDFTT